MTSRWVVVLCIAILSGCTGGQTGQPSEGTGCQIVPWDADEATPYGAPPRALLGGFMGSYRVPLFWLTRGAPHDCPRLRESATQLEIDVHERGNAELKTCGSGAEPAEVSLEVTAHVRTADARVNETRTLRLSTHVGSGTASLSHDTPDGLWAWISRENDGPRVAGFINVGVQPGVGDGMTGAFPTSCPQECAAEPLLEALQLPLPAARVLDALERSSFGAQVEGQPVELRLQTSLMSDRACVPVANPTSPAPNAHSYSLPSRVNLAEDDVLQPLQVPAYTSVLLGPQADCPECVEVTTKTEGYLAPQSALWPVDATEVRAQVEVKLNVGPSGPRSGSGTLQLLVSWRSPPDDSVENPSTYPLTLTTSNQPSGSSSAP
ncbi:MAG TPA: hypothetical protein VI072_32500 [Polyangiaceae bacterium]